MRKLIVSALLGTAVLVPSIAHGQLGSLRKLKDKVKDRVEQRVDAAMEGMLNRVECAATDQACIDEAAAEGKQPVDAEGNTLSTKKPGEGAWANYDFKPGERVLYADDFRSDEVGDFPRRMEFLEGGIEIVEWAGGRWLRSGNEGRFAVPLPETLPDQFTMEFDLFGGGNAMAITFDGKVDWDTNTMLGINGHSGSLRAEPIRAEGGLGVDTNEQPVHIAIMVDGDHVKMYADEKRVFNAPNAKIGRADKIHFALNGWSDENPRMIANLRIAAGGKDLYGALAAEGRVATQGILFDVGSDRIRPESTPTLEEIGSMLKQHADLKLLIEGHTDSSGNADKNQSLSEQRAAAVARYLAETYGVETARLTSQGFGASRPAASNDTPEGRQQNRRVELVKQ